MRDSLVLFTLCAASVGAFRPPGHPGPYGGYCMRGKRAGTAQRRKLDGLVGYDDVDANPVRRRCILTQSHDHTVEPVDLTEELSERAHLHGENDEHHEETILERITAQRERDVRLAEASVGACELDAQIRDFDSQFGAPLDLYTHLRAADGMALAAEFKRASPSKGDIAVGLVAGEQGVRYASVGASVISVLTEGRWFKGTLQDMRDVRIATQTQTQSDADSHTVSQPQRLRPRPAILRKDFIVSPYQVKEARANGADTVLLIVAILEVSQLRTLMEVCRAHGMEPLVEVHTDQELDIALRCGAMVIGVNNRNLHTFKLDLGTTERVAERAFAHCASQGSDAPVVLALSGISGPEDVLRYRECGVKGVLVGEALMRAEDPRDLIRHLMKPPIGALDDGERADLDVAPPGNQQRYHHDHHQNQQQRPIVKICGVTRPTDALEACRSGASLIGVVFAPASKRRVSVEQARAIVEDVRAFGERNGVKRVGLELVAPPSSSVPKEFQGRAASLRAASRRTPLVVGVFQDQPLEEVKHAVAASGVDLVQLHGSEPLEYASDLGIPVIRVLHVGRQGNNNPASGREGIGKAIGESWTRVSPTRGSPYVAYLLDTQVGDSQGGTGESFDWSIARRVSEGEEGLPVLVAGGLHKGNIEEALGAVGSGVLGVDVSSGVEVPGQAGVKDAASIREFAGRALGGGSRTQTGAGGQQRA